MVRTPNLIVHTLERGTGGAGRYGLVVSRKHGGAVQRTRLRRQLRAGMGLGGGPRPGTDSVVVLKTGKRPDVWTVAREIWEIMEDRAGSAGSSP